MEPPQACVILRALPSVAYNVAKRLAQRLNLSEQVLPGRPRPCRTRQFPEELREILVVHAYQTTQIRAEGLLLAAQAQAVGPERPGAGSAAEASRSRTYSTGLAR